MDESSVTPPWMRRLTILFVIAVLLTLVFNFFSAISTVLLGVLAATIFARRAQSGAQVYPKARAALGPG